MTIQQALSEIRSTKKWYYVKGSDGELIPESTLITIAQRIEDNRAKKETIADFFAKFGYEVEINMEVKKNGR